MNYVRHYNALIERAKHRTYKVDEYVEHHHIIPKCMGGNDANSNIVALYPREHYIAHALLMMVYKNTEFASKLTCAFRFMSVDSHNGNRINNKRYDLGRKLFSKNHPSKQKHVKLKISESLKLHYANAEPKVKQTIDILCECGCGEVITKPINSQQRFILNHAQKINNSTPERKKLQSQKIKKHLDSMTDEEMEIRIKNSLGSANHIERGKSISKGKLGKKTNQVQIEIEKYGKMSEQEFEQHIKGRNVRMVTRMTNRRKKYFEQNDDKRI